MTKTKSPNKPRNRQSTTERIFLAQQLRAPDDGGPWWHLGNSEYVLAILTTEKTKAKAIRRAEAVANEHQAGLIAFHTTGECYYRVIRA
jgi:hypothetical protein